MPIYGFHCNSCGDEFETLVRNGEKASCPTCEGEALSQLMSLIAPPSRGGGSTSDSASEENSSSCSSSYANGAACAPSSGHGGGCDCC
jgi:putative FmdB family regulatory protein